MINIGTILRPIGKRYAVRVIKCYPDGETLRIEGEHLTQDLKPTNSGNMFFNIVKDGVFWQQVDKRGALSYHGYSRFKTEQSMTQMDLMFNV